MEFFKYILFGISGLSMIFWVSVIGIWHTFVFQNLFKEDYSKSFSSSEEMKGKFINNSGLINRSKYSRQSFVIADFSPVGSTYSVNRLYTSMLLSLGFMSFIILTYGLHSGFTLYGLN